MYWLLPSISNTAGLYNIQLHTTTIQEKLILSRHVHTIWALFQYSYRFCRVRWIVCTVLSARELHFNTETDSLNRQPIHCGSLVHPHCHSYSGHLDAMPAHTFTPLSTGTVWHGDPLIIFHPLVHLNTKGFLLKNRQQWFCASGPAGRLASY